MNLYSVVNPASGNVEAEFDGSTDSQLDELARAGNDCYRSWSDDQREARAALLIRLADLQLSKLEELANILTREVGKPLSQARAEVQLASDIYRYYGENASRLLADRPFEPRAGGDAVIRYEPIGTILGIMPWNFPLYQIARFVAPNLALGNSVLVKPAPQCPESALAVDRMLAEAGAPIGCYGTALADNDQVADLIADPRISGVSLTGSERAGSAVASLAGGQIKRVVLELGGSDAFIVLDDHDLNTTVEMAVQARCYNAGQMCNAAKRIIVAENVYDQFVDALSQRMASVTVGDPGGDVDMGPMSSKGALEALRSQLEDAIENGATVAVGGGKLDAPGWWMEPTVLVGVTEGMRAFHEELFGPVAAVYRVAGPDEAVALANQSAYGLGAAVFSNDVDLARSVANRLEVGMVWVNSAEGTMPDLPFGGTKRSGFGRELGELGATEFANKKLVYLPASS